MQSSLIGAKWDSRCACERKCAYKSLSLIDTDDYIRLMCGPPKNRFEASNAGSPRKEKGTPWWLSRASKMGCSVVEQRADLGINFLLGCVYVEET